MASCYFSVHASIHLMVQTQVYSNDKVNYWHVSVTQTNPYFVQKLYPFREAFGSLYLHGYYKCKTNAAKKEKSLVVNSSFLNKSPFFLKKNTVFPRLSDANEMEFRAHF